MFPCLSAKLCFNSSSSYGKLIATFVWRGVWDSSILNWTLNFISSCFLVGYPWCFNLMLPVQTESRWSIGCCHDRMWSIAMFAAGRGIFWALVICPRLDCWRIARFKLDSCKLTWLLVGFIHLQSPKRCWDLVVGNLGNSANQEEPVLLWEIVFFFLRLPNFETLVKKVMLLRFPWCQPGFRVANLGFSMLTNLKHGLANQHGHQQKLLSERNIFLEGLTLYRGPAIPGLECFPIFPSAVRRYGISWDSKQWLPFFLLEAGMP